MLIIRKEQFRAFNNYLLESFLNRSKGKFENVEVDKLKSIFKEAIAFGFEEEDHLTEYALLFLNHENAFMKKPDWMNYVLTNKNYEPADKLYRIGSELKIE